MKDVQLPTIVVRKLKGATFANAELYFPDGTRHNLCLQPDLHRYLCSTVSAFQFPPSVQYDIEARGCPVIEFHPVDEGGLQCVVKAKVFRKWHRVMREKGVYLWALRLMRTSFADKHDAVMLKLLEGESKLMAMEG